MMIAELPTEALDLISGVGAGALAMGLSVLQVWNASLDRVEDLTKTWIDTTHALRHDLQATAESGLTQLKTNA